MKEPQRDISEAIAFFEQMLQTLPGDRTSLEFLTVAYEQTGQSEKRRDCLIRLAETLLAEGDYDKAQIVAGHLGAHKDHKPALEASTRVVEAIRRRGALGGPGSVLPGIAPPVEGASMAEVPAPAFQDETLEIQALSRAASTAEIDLVWLWQEHGMLDETRCLDILHLLADRPAAGGPLLISALAILHETHPELTEGVMERMARHCNAPALPLELFEPQGDATALLAPTFMRIRGVLPFALLGEELLVAVLNPLNETLRQETAARSGRVCHFYLAHPAPWSQALDKLK